MASNIKTNILLISLLGLVSILNAQSPALAVADSLYHLDDFSNAIQKYQEVTPKDQYILLQIAKAHRAKGTYTDALSYYKKAITEYSSDAVTKYEYAKLLTTTRKFIKADSVYSILASDYPTNPNFQYRLGIAKKLLKDSTSITYFKKAFSLDSTHQKSCFQISKYYLKKRNYDMVWETANLGLHSYPENVELISILGQNFLLRKDYYGALPYFEKLLALNHKNEFVHSKLGLCYNQTNNFKEAIVHFTEALKYNNKIPERYSMLAYAYQRTENYDKALEYYKTALSLKNLPIEEELFSIALVYRFQEDWEKAIKYTKLSLNENPKYDRAQYQLAMFADAYYKDPKIKLKYYNEYLTKFGQDKKRRYFNNIIEKRIVQLEEEINTNTTKLRNNLN
ncbi:lipopolysaccharide assembly protein LapB [Aquimarina sp. AU474]|uniref:tetratricopeptide repeat protein n=1 Tax=Aquimarina sp. AU474 TaxID=2108529 RepID=UPI000D69EE78|nr:tetratricopeptide repeat protein [Aquimarina sp. AU474]